MQFYREVTCTDLSMLCELHNKCTTKGILNLLLIGNTILNKTLRAGFRTGQAGRLPRDLHNHEASTYVLSHFIFCYSRVGWASTAPLLKAAQRPPHVLNTH